MRRNLGLVAGLALALGVVAALSMYVVTQTQNAMVFRLGEVVATRTEPGLYFKVRCSTTCASSTCAYSRSTPASPSASSRPKRRTCWWTSS